MIMALRNQTYLLEALLHILLLSPPLQSNPKSSAESNSSLPSPINWKPKSPRPKPILTT
ncbi:hypothetical protein EMIT0196MI5_160122 [Pseudomonas sp. IT-196MI5]